MEIINRKIQPGISLIDEITFTKPEIYTLQNNIPVYLINAGHQNLVKIEFGFKGGRWFEEKPLVASFTNKMLREGTTNYSSSDLAEKIDFYGAHADTSTDKDMAYTTLYTLNKYLQETIPLLADMIKNPLFPEKELEVLRRNRKQHFRVNSEKVRYVAKRKFTEQIFGEKHPYGKLFADEDFDNIQANDLIDFHKKNYSASNAQIFVSGKIPDQLPELLDKWFGDMNQFNSQNNHEVSLNGHPLNPKVKVTKKNALQSAIRIGKVLFNKKHPDYFNLKILNTVLGGYFGSRLMTNIREDKGYTYGIGSAIVSLQNAGYFFIASEVGTDVTENAINEVYHEIRLLQQDKIPVKELDLVKNYILGSFLRSMDGPFAISENVKGLIEFGLDYDFYSRFIDQVKNITPEILRDTAQQYLGMDSMCELTVGN
ncbi:MAG: insulinase family protein [Bacteroidales bacterium]|nr:insulinase family protein [Bacteroidales bacterium]